MGTAKLILLVSLLAGTARGQWDVLQSGTTADLRGVQAPGHGVAWASGTEGTVLRTTDDGKTWHRCATPPGAEKLDFRAVQAFDASTAFVMSSGKGALSQLFGTTDGCTTWTLLFTNPDPDGFWDALKFSGQSEAYILGDPVRGSMVLWHSANGGIQWARARIEGGLKVSGDTAAFAASNSGLMFNDGLLVTGFVTGGTHPSLFWRPVELVLKPYAWRPSFSWSRIELPLAKGATAGGYSIAYSPDLELLGQTRPSLFKRIVIVGGDFKKPDDGAGTAVFTIDGGQGWFAAKTLPHGYRSAVAYDSKAHAWITVGPNGTDVSTDDGRNWRPLRPNAAVHQAADADQHWNALSLPFVVGPKGRIGRLRADALKPPVAAAKP